MKKLKAFTVAELLVVAILSLLVASATFSVIRIFNQQYNSYQKDHELAAELDELYTWLQWDCFNSKWMVYQDGRIYFEFDDKTIFYEFGKNEILRKKQSDDLLLRKFKITYNKIKGYLNEEETQREIIDEFQLNYMFLNKERILKVKKKYSAKELIFIDAYQD